MEISPRQKEMIESLPLGIATVNGDGSANLIVVLCAKVVSENEILITDNYMKQTIENLLRDDRVSLGVWTKDEGWKFIGRSKYFTEGKWREFIQNMEENKGMPAKARF